MDAINSNKTAIIALGDQNMRDAGTGQFLLELIVQLNLPEKADLFNCGLNPECVGDDILQYNRIILLTAHNHGDAPGEILFVTVTSDIDNVLKGLPSSLLKTKDRLVELYKSTNREKEVEWILIGVEPKNICPGVSISDDVIKAAPRVLNFINDLLWESHTINQ